jgi:hypothetical protein
LVVMAGLAGAGSAAGEVLIFTAVRSFPLGFAAWVFAAFLVTTPIVLNFSAVIGHPWDCLLPVLAEVLSMPQ